MKFRCFHKTTENNYVCVYSENYLQYVLSFLVQENNRLEERCFFCIMTNFNKY